MKKISSWGRLNAAMHEAIYLSDTSSLAAILSRNKPALPHGMGRSYGDVCLNPDGKLLLTQGLDKFIAFNHETGRLTCEAGVLLRDIQQLMIPRGWSLAVTPGTLWVTVGGAIANDIHGKNHHHFGTFGEHIVGLRLRRMDGEVIDCGPQKHMDWFAATVGGVGLTGLIESAEIQLRPLPGPWLETEMIAFSNLDEFFSLSQAQDVAWEHNVSWFDCMRFGRGLFMQAKIGEQLPIQSKRSHSFTFPKDLPVSLVNSYTLKYINNLYYHLKKSHQGQRNMHHMDFLYPLDGILMWNRLYGPKGMYQYQVVLDKPEALHEMLIEIKKSGQGSCMAVLKTFTHRTPIGMMSFVKKGVTMALDFVNLGVKTRSLLARLDKITLAAQGRVYLAKDACMSRELFEQSYPNLETFLKYRDPGISSGLSRRLMD